MNALLAIELISSTYSTWRKLNHIRTDKTLTNYRIFHCYSIESELRGATLFYWQYHVRNQIQLNTNNESVRNEHTIRRTLYMYHKYKHEFGIEQ